MTMHPVPNWATSVVSNWRRDLSDYYGRPAIDQLSDEAIWSVVGANMDMNPDEQLETNRTAIFDLLAEAKIISPTQEE